MNETKRHMHSTDSKITQLNRVLKDYKQLSDMVHIYKHKANFMSLTSRRKSNDSTFKEPKTVRSYYPSQQWSLRSQTSQIAKPKELYLERVKRMDDIKKKIQENRMKKMQMAKEIKERSKLIKDNLIIYRERIMEENRAKRNMVLKRHQIALDSVMNYKIMKKEYIDARHKEEIEKFSKTNLMKVKELNYWRNKGRETSNELRSKGGTWTYDRKLPNTKSFNQMTFLTHIK